MKGLLYALKQSKNHQRTGLLSLLAHECQKKDLQKALGASISGHICIEARFCAKKYGPGAESPNIPYKTLTFTEAELDELL